MNLKESDINDKSWNSCLIGYFLDGKMAFLLLSSTARKIYKDYGKINIKQIGACFFFEIQDEETKLKVLEGETILLFKKVSCPQILASYVGAIHRASCQYSSLAKDPQPTSRMLDRRVL